MPTRFNEIPGLLVKVVKVVHVPHLDAPPEKPFPFVYFIEIHNGSEEIISIRGRKWILEDDLGEKVVVEGKGVVGETPELKPGEHFAYNSYHVISRDSTVSGAFFGINAAGDGIRVSIPEFRLVMPTKE